MIDNLNLRILSCVLLAAAASVQGCPQPGGRSSESAPPDAQATPAKSFTPADVAKLKWIEGTWRGMDGDKPFYERYRIEGSTMVVESLTDGDPSKVEDTTRFELKDGEFGSGEGDKRSVASEITDEYVQFVPVIPGKGNNFRFQRQPDGTWQALLEWPASGDKAARQKVYKMERWPARVS